MDQLLEHSITYRIAVGPQQGCKVFTLQTLPAYDSDEQFTDTVGKVSGFSLHAGVTTKAHQRGKLNAWLVSLYHKACGIGKAVVANLQWKSVL